jgi:NDP-sugar pyrophosphorylase family protein
LANTFAALKELLLSTKENYEGFLLLHGDTVVGVPLADLVSFHEDRESDMTLLLKAKRELSEQEKRLPEGEVETELDNVLLG